MLSDFEMVCVKLPKEDTVIIPVGDVHLGAKEHCRKAWDEFCETVLNRKNTYLIIGGDLMNNALKNSLSNVYEDVLSPSEQKAQLVAQLTPLKDRILCGVQGNHERRTSRDADQDPLYDVFCKMDIEDRYRQNAAFLKVCFGEITDHRRPAYTFGVVHGNGSSIYTVSSASKAERFGMSIDGIDCLISFHTHKPLDAPIGKLVVDKYNNIVSIKPWRLVVASSWLNYSSYAIQKLLTPTATVHQEIWLRASDKELKVLQ